MADSGYVQLEVVYSGGMIVLSWLVAVIGSWTTLEILLRRTGNAGAMNVMLLLGGGTAFGSTATFGMHFVSASLFISKSERINGNLRLCLFGFRMNRLGIKQLIYVYLHLGKGKEYLSVIKLAIPSSPLSYRVCR